MSKLKCALIGFGYWGKIIYDKILKSEFFEIKYIYSPSFKTTKFYVNQIDTIFKDPEIICLFIASPTQTHFEYTYKAIINDKNVFCEKPLVTLQEDFHKLHNLNALKEKIIYTDYTFLFSKVINSLVKSTREHEAIQRIDFIFEQYGPFYEEHIHWTLLPHVFSIMHSIDNLDNFKYYDIIHKYSKDGFIRNLSFSYKSLKFEGKILLSLEKKVKKRTIDYFVESKDIELRFDLLSNYVEYVQDISSINSKLELNHYDNLEQSINFFRNSIVNENKNRDQLDINFLIAKKVVNAVNKIISL